MLIIAKIRWTKKDEEKLRKTIRNYNNKIRRVNAKSPTLGAFQPEKLRYSELRNTIGDRKEFNRKLNSLKRYTQRGSEQLIERGGELFTKYEIQENAINTRILNTRRTLERKKLGLTTEEGRSQEAIRRGLQPKKFKGTTREEFDIFKASVENMLREDLKETQYVDYKQNYIKALQSNLRDFNIEELIKKLEKIPAKDFFNYSVSNRFTTLEFVYDPQEQDYIFETIIEEWESIV